MTLIRGRPMPSDRHWRRAVLFATGIVIATMSTGCLTSSFVRRTSDPPASDQPNATNDTPAAGRDAQDRSRAGRTDSSVRNASVQAADVPPAGVVLATPFLTSPATATTAPAAEFPLELHAVPTEPSGNLRPCGADRRRPESPPPAKTPLLDAAIQRVADVTRQQREDIASSPEPDPAVEPKQPGASTLIFSTRSPAQSTEAFALSGRNDEIVPLPQRLSPRIDEDLLLAKPSAAPIAQPPVSANPAALQPTPVTADIGKPDAARTLDPPASRAGKSQPTPVEVSDAKPDRAVAAGDLPASDRDSREVLGPEVHVQLPDPAHRSSLGISDLRLCRRVLGFGSFEPLANERIKVGQHLLVYCELTGVQYDMREQTLSRESRLASRSRPRQGGPVLWKRELGDAEDVCRRRRRDYYVNYRVELPKSLGPGSYRLRLLQTDLVAGCCTSSDIPLEITP